MAEKGNVLDAVKEMCKGATLLKAGRSGKPHFRQFQLSPDFQGLVWESPKKSDAMVKFSEITDLIRGQTTKVFQQNPIPEHKDLSFSLVYGKDRTLDLVCKDKREYEVWISGVEALRKGQISQQEIEEIKSSIKAEGGDKVQVVFDNYNFSTKVVIREDASDVYTWGDGKNGKLGHGDDTDEYNPRILEALLGRDIVALACGSSHTIVVTDEGEVYSWGVGAGGRLGNGKERSRYTPLAISGLRGRYVTQVACGDSHSAAISGNGVLFTWGRGDFGQLGVDVSKQLVPMEVDSTPWDGKQVAQVSCGKNFTVVVIEDGRVFSFGQGDYGQLGQGDRTNLSTPKCIDTKGVLIQKVACGYEHVAAVSDKGQLYTWGYGPKGQLGHGDEQLDVPMLKPKLVEALASQEIIDVACGGHHTAVITANGSVCCFGDGQYGQLGYGTGVKQAALPKAITMPDNKKVIMVACGEYHTAALTESFQICTWGLASNGRLGHDFSKDKLAPAVIESMAGKQVRSIACGGCHTCATVTHGWIPDKEAKDCMACKKKFTQVRRRHHCRKCGGVFCGGCSSKKYPLLEAGFSEPVRVCDKCYLILSKN